MIALPRQARVPDNPVGILNDADLAPERQAPLSG
jgi:hypothetical protein